MTGRGIDQLMAEPVPPVLYERWVRDARDYLGLAERIHGPIARPVAPEYLWGDALGEKARLAPDRFIVNLETAITVAATPWPGKGIHYRMSPRHVDCLSRAGVDACALANNHVLDWGHEGLRETLEVLRSAGVACAGAGPDEDAATAPAVLPLPGEARLLVFAWATPSSGVPAGWRARRGQAGVALIESLEESDAQAVLACVQRHRGAGDRVVVSLHWGANWVDEVPMAHRRFAHRLIDLGAADIVHGHSSHHPLPIEVHDGRPILYGCGDLVNDYEGIAPHGRMRSDMACLYAVTLARADGRLRSLEIVPLQLRRFRLGRPEPEALDWLRRLLADGCGRFGIRLEQVPGAGWCLRWD